MEQVEARTEDVSEFVAEKATAAVDDVIDGVLAYIRYNRDEGYSVLRGRLAGHPASAVLHADTENAVRRYLEAVLWLGGFAATGGTDGRRDRLGRRAAGYGE